jgi:hypothetical protein
VSKSAYAGKRFRPHLAVDACGPIGSGHPHSGCSGNPVLKRSPTRSMRTWCVSGWTAAETEAELLVLGRLGIAPAAAAAGEALRLCVLEAGLESAFVTRMRWSRERVRSASSSRRSALGSRLSGLEPRSWPGRDQLEDLTSPAARNSACSSLRCCARFSIQRPHLPNRGFKGGSIVV